MDSERDVGGEREGKISRVLASDSLYWKEERFEMEYGKLLPLLIYCA